MESALVIPVLLVLLVGVLEYGRLLVSEVAVVQIARDAALAGARTAEADDPDAVSTARAGTGLTAAGLEAGASSVVVSRVTLPCGEAIQVHVSVPFDAIVPLVPVPGNLAASTTARLEDQ